MSAVSESFADSLVRVTLETISVGDYVYVRHQFGGVKDVSWTRARVIDVVRKACTLRFENPRSERTVPFQQVYREPLVDPRRLKEVPATVSTPKPTQPARKDSAPARESESKSADDDQFSAWLSMGRDLLGEIAAGETSIASELEQVDRHLEQIDATHRRTIEALEAELTEAKRAHQDDRALAATRREMISTKLKALQERRATIEQMIGGKR